MPVQLTYPGVYVEEIPSGVRTITGASTSVALFVGYTPRGPLDKPVRVFNFGEYERAFGGLDPSSDLSYAVYHYFLNGGSDAYVIRAAAGAAKARLSLQSGPTVPPIDSPTMPTLASLPHVLDVSALRVGAEGNRVALQVMHVDGEGHNDLFDLMVDPQDGGTPEAFHGLSMDPYHPAYAVTAINQRSNLIRVNPLDGSVGTAIGDVQGRCVGALLTLAELTPLLAGGGRFAISYNDGPYVEVTLPTMTAPGGTFTGDAARSRAYGGYLASTIETAVRGQGGVYTTFSCRWDEPEVADYVDPLPDAAAYGRLIALSGSTRASSPGATSAVSFQAVPGNSFATAAKLTKGAGAREYASASFVRPAQNGTETGDLWQAARILADLGGDVGFDVVATGLPPSTPAGPPTSATHFVAFAGTGPGAITADMTLEALRSRMEARLRTVNAPHLSGASVELCDGRFVIRPSGGAPNVVLQLANARTAATGGTSLPRAMRALGLDAQRSHTARSVLGSGLAIGLQGDPSPGADGARSGSPTYLLGNENAKTGMYAAADVDAFNLLCFPGVTTVDVLGPAAAYCERRRAVLIVDPPEDFAVAPGASLNDAVRSWYTNPSVSPPFSKNVAVYHPRILAPDPMAGGAVRAFPPCGAVAGVIARTDSERGIWKAPAGVDAALKGATGLKHRLTEQEVGVLNQAGLNCLREMPLYGQVVWGARTRVGGDDAPSEWKYLPVRRLALYVEESLYRGTQWAVFEPNDEPLWAQLRLNVGAFMNSLFRQGAFQGKSAREAYFVKCDGEVNTQDDVNRGRVNVVVGFAPLKPAEFVVIRLQQIAGQTPT